MYIFVRGSKKDCIYVKIFEIGGRIWDFVK